MRRALQQQNPVDGPASTVTGASLVIAPARRISGTLSVPGDKSISHRYVMLAALARGTTTITGLSSGADVASTISCLRGLGARVDQARAGAVTITGAPFVAPHAPLDAGNSGTTMRLLAGILAGCPFSTILCGDASLSRRPMQRVVEPLTRMGAAIDSREGRPPLTIHGRPLRGIRYVPPVASAQVKSAILFAGLSADGRTEVSEPVPTRDHTERAFPHFGVRVTTAGASVSLEGPQFPEAPAGVLGVPGDPSAAAVWAAAAAGLPGSSMRIDDVCLNPRRTGFLRLLARMGAHVSTTGTTEVAGEPRGSIHVAAGSATPATVAPAEVPDLIDELPVLAASAALGGGLDVSGAGELRVKESDRITALVAGFRQLGVHADERADGFTVPGGQRPTGGTADAAGDHRLVMAFAILALAASGPTSITGAEVVSVSYPGFAGVLEGLRA